jgi:lipopolysaccharide transport system permease protein
MELFRIWFYGTGHVPVAMTVSSIVVTAAIAFFGMVLFTNNERAFMDVI